VASFALLLRPSTPAAAGGPAPRAPRGFQGIAPVSDGDGKRRPATRQAAGGRMHHRTPESCLRNPPGAAAPSSPTRQNAPRSHRQTSRRESDPHTLRKSPTWELRIERCGFAFSFAARLSSERSGGPRWGLAPQPPRSIALWPNGTGPCRLTDPADNCKCRCRCKKGSQTPWFSVRIGSSGGTTLRVVSFGL